MSFSVSTVVSSSATLLIRASISIRLLSRGISQSERRSSFSTHRSLVSLHPDPRVLRVIGDNVSNGDDDTNQSAGAKGDKKMIMNGNDTLVVGNGVFNINGVSSTTGSARPLGVGSGTENGSNRYINEEKASLVEPAARSRQLRLQQRQHQNNNITAFDSMHNIAITNKSTSPSLVSSSSPEYLVNGLSSSSSLSHERKSFASDLVVVLDMDECLIHSQFLSDKDKYRQKEQRPNHNLSSSNLESNSLKTKFCDAFCISLPGGDIVQVNKRPFLDKFLQKICATFETYIFTAAMKVYASPVLDTLDPNGEYIVQRFYRESCSLDPDLGVYIKDLNHIFSPNNIHNRNHHHYHTANHNNLPATKLFNERRVVLVDNNPLSFLANPSNGILVSSFYDDPNDDTLQAVLDLLMELDGMADVRPTLQHLFGLEQALNGILYPNGMDGSGKR